jgi:hypothetical protein
MPRFDKKAQSCGLVFLTCVCVPHLFSMHLQLVLRRVNVTTKEIYNTWLIMTNLRLYTSTTHPERLFWIFRLFITSVHMTFCRFAPSDALRLLKRFWTSSNFIAKRQILCVEWTIWLNVLGFWSLWKNGNWVDCKLVVDLHLFGWPASMTLSQFVDIWTVSVSGLQRFCVRDVLCGRHCSG